MKSKTIILFALLVLCSPSLSHAFFAENARITQVLADTWLYIITAQYGSDDGEVTMPIAAAPNWKPRVSGEYLRYQVLLSDRPFAGLDTAAIVLSDAPIVDNQYVVPAGASYSFTIMALITIPNVAQNEQINLSLEVTSGE